MSTNSRLHFSPLRICKTDMTVDWRGLGAAEGHSSLNPILKTEGHLFRALWSSQATPTEVGVCKPVP